MTPTDRFKAAARAWLEDDRRMGNHDKYDVDSLATLLAETAATELEDAAADFAWYAENSGVQGQAHSWRGAVNVVRADLNERAATIRGGGG